MLENFGNDHGGRLEKMANPERCQPDYEAMINRLRPRVIRTIAFRDAALNYCEGKTAKEDIATLIGELVTESAQLQCELDGLIAEQEKASKKETK